MNTNLLGFILFQFIVYLFYSADCSKNNELKEKELEITNNGTNWAVLIAGSNGYYNYRHQSDVAHAYQILTELGSFPSENIIVMMYNDIVNNTDNPIKGKLFNQPGGHDVYKGIHIDYNNTAVNAVNFLNVIQGNSKEAEKTIGPNSNGKVLKSGPNDNVFIYYTDHGATGIVGMPTGDPLYANDLISALNYMYNNNMYNKLVFYLEACESGSMFSNGLLNKNISVYANTAANPYESSYAYYYNETLQTYMADEYSIRWMQDTTNFWNLEYELLLQQYINVKNIVTESHPQKYGDFSFDNETIEDFQAYDDQGHEYNNNNNKIKYNTNKNNNNHNNKHNRFNSLNQRTISTFVPSRLAVDSRDVKLFTLQNKYVDAKTWKERSLYSRLVKLELRDRKFIDDSFFGLVKYLTGYAATDDIYQVIKSYYPPKNFVCLKQAYKTWENSCFKFNEYGLKYVQTLVNLCELFPMDDIIESIIDACGQSSTN